MIEGNKIEGFYTAITGPGGVSYWDIQNNQFNNDRTGVHYNTSNNMLISGNTFSNYLAGVGGTEATTGNTITGNTFLGDIASRDGDLADYREAIGMTDDVVDLTITNNIIRGGLDNDPEYGIVVYDNGGAGVVDATISGNSIVSIGTDGLLNNTDTNVTAENNWWGAADGPGGDGPGAGSPVADTDADDIDFTPWDEHVVTVTGTGAGDYEGIQAAVTAAGAGSTVTVPAGIFEENVTIAAGKDGLTLVGAGADDTMILVTNNSFGIKVVSPSVDISGFHIKDANTGYSDCASNCGVWASASGTSGAHTVIHDNTIEGFYNGVGGAGGEEYWDIVDNTFDNNRTGVFFNTKSNILIDGNTFSNYFAGIGGTENTHDNTVSNNTFLGVFGDLDPGLAGFIGSVEAIGMTDDVVNMSIIDNVFSGSNDFGIQVYDNNGTSELIDADIQGNDITGASTFALKNNSDKTTTAHSNWWGTAVPASIDALLDGEVIFNPWYTSSGLTTRTADLSSPDIDLTIAAGSQATSIVVNAGDIQAGVANGDTFTVTSSDRDLIVDGHTSAGSTHACVDGTATVTITGGIDGEVLTIVPTDAACVAEDDSEEENGGGGGGGSGSKSKDKSNDETPAPSDNAGGQLAALTSQLRGLIAQLVALGGTPSPELLAMLGGEASNDAGVYTRDLDVGDTGADVHTLQLFLIAQNKGPAAAALAANGATQYFGLLTKAALAEFQSAAGIAPAVGYFGPMTRAYIAGL